MSNPKYRVLDPTEPSAQRHVKPVQNQIAQGISIVSWRHAYSRQRVGILLLIQTLDLETPML